MTAMPEGFVRHVRACTNAVLPGSRTRLHIGGAPIGWVHPRDTPPAPLAGADGFADYVHGLQTRGAFAPRHELFDVRDETTGAVLTTIDRGAIPLLGIRAEGVHLNGLVDRSDGLHLWVGRRARTRQLEPGKLDHLVAGGIPAGHNAQTTLVKEAAEEASLSTALLKRAEARGTVSYAMEREGDGPTSGLRRDRLHCFDLFLPEDFVPQPNDDEVEGFMLWPLHKVASRVAETDDFKFNVNVVLIDLFVRTGLIDTGSPGGAAVLQALQPLRTSSAGGVQP